ncbi:hypothetical protein [Streptomonospora wellingtoniae]|uniref:Uncharacterized protein n=1 Tax=Streptomonospora wellingtoniae TaxID=3075544 RepID=A0ABU2KUB9_9ACTN|nr:hypothetical protein [Streptomonospora sp. DSM 45055]MDT0302853.1 hypothetical protein [Streptomonospora sp. DSM 45055]
MQTRTVGRLRRLVAAGAIGLAAVFSLAACNDDSGGDGEDSQEEGEIGEEESGEGEDDGGY